MLSPSSLLNPPLTKKETWAWYLYDWSSSAISSVVLFGFLPLLLQDAALKYAGFPDVCENLVRNISTIHEVFGENSTETEVYYIPKISKGFYPDDSCRVWDEDNFVWCPGVPTSSDDCYVADLHTKYPLYVPVLGTTVNPATYSSGIQSMAVVCQMIVFISLSAYCDGPHRKAFLLGLTLLGSFVCILGILIDGPTYQFGAFVFTIVSICYATSFVSYSAYLPILASKHPEVLSCSDPDRKAQILENHVHEIGNKGYAVGYGGSLTSLLLCVVIILFSPDAITGYAASCLVAGCWWLGFSIPTALWLRKRPIKSTSDQYSHLHPLVAPWRRLAGSIYRWKENKQVFIFLAIWFIYSDGMNVITTISLIVANTSVSWKGVDKTTGLAVILFITPIFALLGNLFWGYMYRVRKMKPMTILNWNLFLMSLTPIYGLTGLLSDTLGYRVYYELYLGVLLYGFSIGALQSFSRSCFSLLIPDKSQASQYFSLYNVTDKGASAIGAAVVSAIVATSDARTSFWYPFLCLFLSIFLNYFLLDEIKPADDLLQESAFQTDDRIGVHVHPVILEHSPSHSPIRGISNGSVGSPHSIPDESSDGNRSLSDRYVNAVLSSPSHIDSGISDESITSPLESTRAYNSSEYDERKGLVKYQ